MPEAPCSDVLFKPAEAVVLNKCLLEQAASGSTFLWSCEELPLAFPENPELNRFLHMLLVVPLFSRGQMTGFVLIGESRPGYDHTPDELRMCELLANHVAIVLEQATLLADIQELESIKSKLIRMASHDLRGPLSRIRMMLDFLEDQLHSVLSIQQQAYFVKLQNAINQIEELITNILSMERIEARHRFTQPVVWQDLISQVVESMSIELMSSKHRLVFECAPNLPVMRADKEDLNRALSNLLGNAIKYTPPGGQITIRAFLQDYGGRPQLYVEVADTGIGIPKEKQKQLFQPFYRAQQAGTENISGMGLGLSIVKSAVEYHNGAVFVISEQGRGSMFGFRLPI
jgi:signal transduction histidine kinase